MPFSPGLYHRQQSECQLDKPMIFSVVSAFHKFWGCVYVFKDRNKNHMFTFNFDGHILMRIVELQCENPGQRLDY